MEIFRGEVARQNGGMTAQLLAGAPVDGSRFYRVVISDFLLSGGETGLAFLTREAEGVRDVRELRDIRMALIDELRSAAR